MDGKTTYAVVDIETTGGNVQTGDRIIQFGCVLIENDQIVHQFAVDINPLRTIPKEIERLTGISNQSVAHAPYFEDVAATLANLLNGCIFVAHNIQFDYQFLSEEFVRCGLPPLNQQGIDTVELAQILLPTESSFALNELMNALQIEHKNPHQADSDAYATGELFLLLKRKAQQLPLVTVERLAELAVNCTMDTELFFSMNLEEMRQEVAELPADILIKKGMAIQKKTVSYEQISYREKNEYPVKAKDKEILFQHQFELRNTQIQMMDEIHYTLKDIEKSHLAIEAPTGIGKTIGYLFPAVYHATKDKPTVISTYTTLLQQQIMQKDIPQLQQIVSFPIQAAILKGKGHYLHLSKFDHLLDEPVHQKLEAVYQMKVLVWLTQTKTGDLEELNLTNYNHDFWGKIRHRGWLGDEKQDDWYDEDFYLHALKLVQHASLIITNHAYLCHDFQNEVQVLKPFDALIVDEAHHLSEVASQSTANIFRYYDIQKALKWLGKTEDTESLMGILAVLEERATESLKHHLRDIDMTLYLLNESLSSLVDEWLLYCRDQIIETDFLKDRYDIPFDEEKSSVKFKRNSKGFLQLMREAALLGIKVVERLYNEKERFSQNELHKITEFYDLMTDLENQASVFDTIFNRKLDQYVTWFSFAEKSPKNSFSVHQMAISNQHFLKKHLVENISNIIYTGATLEIDGSFDYFQKQIGETHLRTLKLASSYDYAKQVKFWVPKEVTPIKSMNKKRYAEMVVHYLNLVSKNSNENMLVLFTSFETLYEVYEVLKKHPAFSGREIVAQGLSGSRERILKRFFRSQGGILLGADSFWEGVDLPGKSLSIIVVTRLPFESPDRPFVKAKHHWLKKNHVNPFYSDTVPKAALRLKQGLGRLIRSQTDKGVFIVLDERLIHSNFGKKMQQSLPEGILIEEIEETSIEKQLSEFLTDEG